MLNNNFVNNQPIPHSVIIFFVKLAMMAMITGMFIFLWIMPQYTTNYNAALIDKYKILHEISDPRIIIVGDSNIAFGIDSEMIQQTFDMPVVNFGLHGGIGRVFYTDLIKSNIHEGDVVVLAPSAYYASTLKTDCVLVWLGAENNISLLREIPAKYYWDMLLAFPTYLKRALNLFVTGQGNAPVEGAYARTAFNEYGDNVYPKPKSLLLNETSFGAHFQDERLSQNLKDYWNDYNKYALSKGAVLYMSSPPILSVALNTDLQLMQEQLEENLDFPMISILDDYVYPLEYFYDTGMHLTDDGKKIRTEQLIKDMMVVLNK